MGTISKDGQAVLALIGKGADTGEAIERATRRDPEDVARTLAALTRRGVVRRRFRDGEMRYEAT